MEELFGVTARWVKQQLADKIETGEEHDYDAQELISSEREVCAGLCLSFAGMHKLQG